MVRAPHDPYLRTSLTGSSLGSLQSGELFRSKVLGLEKQLERFFNAELVYPTAPFAVETEKNSATVERHGTWRWVESEVIDGIYPGLDISLEALATVLKNSGPFDGVIGFGQGAAIGTMLASLLEHDRASAFSRFAEAGGVSFSSFFAELGHPPLKFLVAIAGYKAVDQAYRAFYEPLLRTPSLHIHGCADTIVDEDASNTLVGCFQPEQGMHEVIRHQGGHTTPAGKFEILCIMDFICSRQRTENPVHTE